jgi:hypothetical protein
MIQNRSVKLTKQENRIEGKLIRLTIAETSEPTRSGTFLSY